MKSEYKSKYAGIFRVIGITIFVLGGLAAFIVIAFSTDSGGFAVFLQTIFSTFVTGVGFMAVGEVLDLLATMVNSINGLRSDQKTQTDALARLTATVREIKAQPNNKITEPVNNIVKETAPPPADSNHNQIIVKKQLSPSGPLDCDDVLRIIAGEKTAMLSCQALGKYRERLPEGLLDELNRVAVQERLYGNMKEDLIKKIESKFSSAIS